MEVPLEFAFLFWIYTSVGPLQATSMAASPCDHFDNVLPVESRVVVNLPRSQLLKSVEIDPIELFLGIERPKACVKVDRGEEHVLICIDEVEGRFFLVHDLQLLLALLELLEHHF